MSGLESDSDSEPAHEDDVAEQIPCEETTYVPFQEEEFGEVSATHFVIDQIASINIWLRSAAGRASGGVGRGK